MRRETGRALVPGLGALMDKDVAEWCSGVADKGCTRKRMQRGPSIINTAKTAPLMWEIRPQVAEQSVAYGAWHGRVAGFVIKACRSLRISRLTVADPHPPDGRPH